MYTDYQNFIDIISQQGNNISHDKFEEFVGFFIERFASHLNINSIRKSKNISYDFDFVAGTGEKCIGVSMYRTSQYKFTTTDFVQVFVAAKQQGVSAKHTYIFINHTPPTGGLSFYVRTSIHVNLIDRAQQEQMINADPMFWNDFSTRCQPINSISSNQQDAEQANIDRYDTLKKIFA